MGQTTIRQIPYPESTEAADVPTDMKEMADKLDTFGYVPIGAMMIWPMAGVPDANWLPCDGNPVPAGYPLLKAIMNNTPNMQGRVIVGVGTLAGGGTYALNGTGGEEKHLLTAAELPSHVHDASTLPNSSNMLTAAGWIQNVEAQSGTGRRVASPISPEGTQVRTGPNANMGPDSNHNNMQPYLALNFIIRGK